MMPVVIYVFDEIQISLYDVDQTDNDSDMGNGYR